MSVFMQAIGTQTVGSSGVTGITFNNIPQGFTDLKIIASVRTTANNDYLGLFFNGLYSGYVRSNLYGNGLGGVYSGRSFYRDIGGFPGTGYTSNTFALFEIDILNYASANQKQTVVTTTFETAASEAYPSMTSYLSTTTSPITSVHLDSSGAGANFAQYSTFTLYGVASSYVGGTPTAPTIGSVTDQAGFASVSFTPATNDQAVSYAVTSVPSGVTTYGATSPILTRAALNTSYVYKVSSVNDRGVTASAESSPVTTTNSYSSIATLTVTGTASQLVFTNIPQNYTHLQLRGVSRGTASNADNVVGYQVNVDGGTNYGYGWHYLAGNGASAFSGNGGGANYPTTYSTYTPGTGVTANAWSNSILDIFDYTNTGKYKTFKAIGGFDANGSGYVNIGSGVWLSYAPISSITVILANNPYTLAVGSTFSLYGIA